MKTKLTFFVGLLFYALTAVAQEQRNLQILFANNSSTIEQKEMEKLESLHAALHGVQVLKIEISGHTDSDADNDYNLRLADKRTKSVSDFFKQSGYALEIISTKSLGEEIPSADNNTEEGQQLNRRAEVKITFYKGGSGVSDEMSSIKSESPTKEKTKVEESEREFNLPQGTKVIVKECCFPNIDVNSIRIEATEAVGGSGLLENGLQTIDEKGNCLRSGGMVFFKFYDKNGKELKPNRDCQPTVLIPTEAVDPELNIYKASDSGKLNSTWVTDGDKPETVVKDGKTYYSVRSSGGGINMDKVKGIAAKVGKEKKPNYFKTQGFDKPTVYVHDDSTVVNPKFFAKRKFRAKEECDCVGPNAMLTVVAKKNDKTYFYRNNMNLIEPRGLLSNKYKIPKRRYKQVSEQELQRLMSENDEVVINSKR